ncbi:MAG: nucleotide exchange factor GrpE [Peptococcaceae bacterium]|jgi:molecular chaperone GrpE|nr:nucleotide exchange factor GrpE [Peptococcaceae bacterium]
MGKHQNAEEDLTLGQEAVDKIPSKEATIGGEAALEDETNAENLAAEADYESLKNELEQAKAKAEDYYAGMQRLKAEFDNFRKRTQREKEEISKYAAERIILSLLPVIDNFERAIESTANNKDFESFSQGVNLIFRQLYKVLEDEGLKAIEAVGQQFDPNLHEAMMKEESDQEENIVLEEFQKGYFLKDKVIRFSKVKVSG